MSTSERIDHRRSPNFIDGVLARLGRRIRRGPSGSCTAIGPLVTTAIGAVDVLAALLILDHDPHRDRA